MRNTLKKGRFDFLIYQKNTKFIGICKQTGYVEEADNFDDVRHRLINGTIAILKAVKKDKRLLPSINQRPPLKYLILFYLIPIWYALRRASLCIFNKTSLELTKNGCYSC